MNLRTIITRAAAKASKPCVAFLVNQPWGYSTSDRLVANAQSSVDYPQYRDACYQLANENPDTVFVIDFWKDLTDSTHLEYAPHGGDASVGGALTDRDWYNDGTHLLDVGNFARAQMLFNVLAAGIQSPGSFILAFLELLLRNGKGFEVLRSPRLMLAIHAA